MENRLPEEHVTNHAVEMKQISKKFGTVVANDHIDFSLVAGETHAVLGENGAGKTTLMKILYGLYQQDEGEIYIYGVKASISSPKHAINLGIGIVQQHSSLVKSLTVTENVILGLKSSRKPFIDIRTAEKRIKELSETYHFNVDPRAKIWQLSVGQRVWVEILRIMYRDARILLLDEPTATLIPQEVEELFKIIHYMKKRGRSIVFITHKIREALEISDRVTVLRDGRVVDTIKRSEADAESLAKLMVGRGIIPARASSVDKSLSEKKNVVLQVEGLKALSDKGSMAVNNISFSVKGGEILGIAGVAGNGQNELVETIIGYRKAKQGRVLIKGKDVTNISTAEVLRLGVVYIPEDRLGKGLLMNLSVADNMVLGIHQDSRFVNRKLLLRSLSFLNRQEIQKYSKRLISKFNIKAPNELVPVKCLSGGNLQKIIIARALYKNPDLLIASSPTRGLDITATEFVRRKILEERERGAAILLVSMDLDEILRLSDRIAIIYSGEIVGTMPADKPKIGEIGLMMAGITQTEKNTNDTDSQDDSALL